MEIILLIGAAESIFLFLLIVGKKQKQLSDFALGTMFLLFAFSIGLTWLELYNAKNSFPYPAVINLSWLILFLQGPALWLYVKSFTVQKFQLKPIYLLHLIPFLYFIVFHYFDFISLPVAEKIAMAETDVFKAKLSYKISVLAIGISTIGYNIWALILIRNYRKKLKLNFSSIERIDLNWLRILVWASIMIYFLNSILFVVDMVFQFATYHYLMLLTYSFASIYIFFLGYFGLQQGDVFITNRFYIEDEHDGPDTTGTPTERTEEKNGFVNSLLVFMENKQPYLDPEITVLKLSDMLSVKPEYLSEVLNKKLNQNFFDFINKYRIEEFKIQSIVESNRHLSIIGIAHNCGFNSKAAFYRAFNKFERTTPSAYVSASHKK